MNGNSPKMGKRNGLPQPILVEIAGIGTGAEHIPCQIHGICAALHRCHQ